MYLTISRVTMSEMGTKLVKSSTQLPHFTNISFDIEINLPYYSITELMVSVEIRAAVKVSNICAPKIPSTVRPILN